MAKEMSSVDLSPLAVLKREIRRLKRYENKLRLQRREVKRKIRRLGAMYDQAKETSNGKG